MCVWMDQINSNESCYCNTITSYASEYGDTLVEVGLSNKCAILAILCVKFPKLWVGRKLQLSTQRLWKSY